MTETPKPKLTEIEWLQAEKTKHKKAFRVAFDALEHCWPPEHTEEYFKMAVDHLTLLHHENSENGLCRLLLVALIDYLEKAGKERKELYEPSNNADAGMDGG